MAKQFQNEKGFLIIEMSPEEAKLIGLGFRKGCICMHCNNIIKDKIYYVAVLNDVMDKECLDNWMKDAVRYEEDIHYEEEKYNLAIMSLICYGIRETN